MGRSVWLALRDNAPYSGQFLWAASITSAKRGDGHPSPLRRACSIAPAASSRWRLSGKAGGRRNRWCISCGAWRRSGARRRIRGTKAAPRRQVADAVRRLDAAEFGGARRERGSLQQLWRGRAFVEWQIAGCEDAARGCRAQRYGAWPSNRAQLPRPARMRRATNCARRARHPRSRLQWIGRSCATTGMTWHTLQRQ